jgi:hypothetical protein
MDGGYKCAVDGCAYKVFDNKPGVLSNAINRTNYVLARRPLTFNSSLALLIVFTIATYQIIK